eukprot:Seg733.5 transcript_id=Seg733.5/GoldUCD/mRNA.D3Y31 product="hypothetical protein" protein_id=Seg733.5/GoldUCD/D3Y31
MLKWYVFIAPSALCHFGFLVYNIYNGIEPVKHGTAQNQEESWNEIAPRKDSDYVRKWINDNATEITTKNPISFVDDRNMSQVSPTISSTTITTKKSVAPQVSPTSSSISCDVKTSVGDRSLPTCVGKETEVICLDDSDANYHAEIPRTGEGSKSTGKTSLAGSALVPNHLVEISRNFEQCSNEETSNDHALFAAGKQKGVTLQHGEQQLAKKRVSCTNKEITTRRDVPEHSFQVTNKYEITPVIVLSDESESDYFGNDTSGSVASDNEVDRVCLRLLYPSLRIGRESSVPNKSPKSASHDSTSQSLMPCSQGSKTHLLHSNDAEGIQRSHPTNLCEGSCTQSPGSLQSFTPGSKFSQRPRETQQTPENNERHTIRTKPVGIIGNSSRSRDTSSDSDSTANEVIKRAKQKRSSMLSSRSGQQTSQHLNKKKRETNRKQKTRMTGFNDRSSVSSLDSYSTTSETTERMRKEKTSTHRQEKAKQKSHRLMRILASDKSSSDISSDSETSASETIETARKEKTNIVRPGNENQEGPVGQGSQKLDKNAREMIRQQWIKMVGNDYSLMELSSDSGSNSESDARNAVEKQRVGIAGNSSMSSDWSEDSSSDSECVNTETAQKTNETARKTNETAQKTNETSRKTNETPQQTKHDRASIVLDDSQEKESQNNQQFCKQMSSDDAGSYMTCRTEKERISMNTSVSSDIIVIDDNPGHCQEPTKSQDAETRNGQLGVSVSQISKRIQTEGDDEIGLDLPTERVGNENSSLDNHSCEHIKLSGNSGFNKDVVTNLATVEPTDTVISQGSEQMFRKLPTIMAPPCIIKGTNAIDSQYRENIGLSGKSNVRKGVSMNLKAIEQNEIIVDQETEEMKTRSNLIAPCTRRVSNASLDHANKESTISGKRSLSQNLSIDLSIVEQNEIIVDKETEEMKTRSNLIAPCTRRINNASVDHAYKDSTISGKRSLSQNLSIDLSTVEQNEIVVDEETYEEIAKLASSIDTSTEKVNNELVDESVAFSRKGNLNNSVSMNLTAIKQNEIVIDKDTDKLIIDSLTEDTVCSTKDGQMTEDHSYEGITVTGKGNLDVDVSMNLTSVDQKDKTVDKENDRLITDSLMEDIVCSTKESNTAGSRSNENMTFDNFILSGRSTLISKDTYLNFRSREQETVTRKRTTQSSFQTGVWSIERSRDSGAARQLFGDDTGENDLTINDSFVILNSSEELIIDHVDCAKDDTQYEKDNKQYEKDNKQCEKDNKQCEIKNREYKRDNTDCVEDNRECAESIETEATTRFNSREDILSGRTLKRKHVPSNLFEKLMEENTCNNVEVRPLLASSGNLVSPVPSKDNRDIDRHVNDSTKGPSNKMAASVLEKFNISPCRVVLSPCYNNLIKRPTSVSERIKLNITKALNENASAVDDQSFVLSPVAENFSNSHPFDRLGSFVELEAYDSDGSELSFTIEIDKVDETDEDSCFASNNKECMPLSHMKMVASQSGEGCVKKKRRVDKVIGSIPVALNADNSAAIYQKAASDSQETPVIGQLKMPKLTVDHGRHNDGVESLSMKFADRNDRFSTVYIVQRATAKSCGNTQRNGKKSVPSGMSVPYDFRRRNPLGRRQKATSNDEFYLPRDFENTDNSSDECIRHYGRHTRREHRSCPHCKKKREELLNITKCFVWLERIDPTKYNLITHHTRPRMNYKPRHRKELFSNKGTSAKSQRKLRNISADLSEKKAAKKRKNGKRKLSRAEKTKLSIERSLCFINKRITNQNSLNSILKWESCKLLG